MATPDAAARIYETKRDVLSLERRARRQDIQPDLQSSTPGPNGSPCARARSGPSSRGWSPAPPIPVAGSFSDFTLQLDREDGDQFLGDLNFTMPPGLDRQPARASPTARRRRSRPRRRARPRRAGAPELPGELADRNDERRRRAGLASVPRGGRDVPGRPLQGRAASLVAITPALAGPYDYGTVVVRVAIYVDPLDAHVIAVSDTVPEIIGGVPIRMRSIQVNIDKPELHDQPDQLRARSRSTRRGSATRARSPTSPPTSTRSTASRLRFKPQMTMRQLGGRKDDAAQPRTRRCGSTSGPAPATPTSGRSSVTLPNAFAIDQRHLGNICSRAELAAEHCAGRQPIGMADDETPLLDQPLEGPAYAVSGFGGLPHVAFILDGQVTVMPRGRIVVGQRRTTEDHRSGRPRRPGRPLPPQPLRRQAGLSRQHAQPLRSAGVSKVGTPPRTAGRLTQRASLRRPRCGKPSGNDTSAKDPDSRALSSASFKR